MATAAEKAAKEARNAYYREWRAANRDKVKKYNDDYWKRKAEKAAAAEDKADE